MDIKKFLKQQTRFASPWLYIAISAGAVSGLVIIAKAWLIAKIVSGVIFSGYGLAEIKNYLILLVILFITRAILLWLGEQAGFKAAGQVKLQLRQRLQQHLHALGPIKINREQTGTLINTVMDGIEALEDYYARYLPTMAMVAIIPPAILLVILPHDWISGLVLLLTAPVIPFFMIMIGKGTEELNKKQWRKLARMSGHLLDLIQGMTTLKIFNASRKEAEVVAEIADDYRKSTMSVLRVAFLSSLLLEFFSSIGIAIVAVLIGFRLLHTNMEFIHGFFILILAPEFYLPLRNLGTYYHARMDAIGAAEKINQLLEEPVEQAASKITSLPAPIENIFFRDVSFSYEKDRQAIKACSFTIHRGERVALVGKSGAGKSTIINLLTGFIQPDKGEIFIDDHNLQDIDRDAWWQKIAWLPQKPYLFYGSISDNIRMGKVDASQEEVEAAARQAHCHDFISKLNKGYQTIIGSKGSGLSGGQAQRVALARVFLKNAEIIILDEATAHLDKKSEQLVQQSINNINRNKTIITIAHRLETIQQADKIIMLAEGRVVAFGDHSGLYKQDDAYKTMIDNYHKMNVLDLSGY